MIAGTIEIQLMAGIARLQKDMDQARGMVDKATGAMGKAAGIAGMALGALAGALSISAFTGWIRGAIDAADAAGKLSQKTGIAVKDLAGIELAYQQAGVSAEAMSTSMSRLSKGIVEGSKTLDALGIKSKSIDGSFKSNKEVLYAVADGFAGLNNGAQKTALAMELFGKSGADMIPLLNGGSESLREMDEMARKLGLTMSEETAANAEKFNDTLDLLSMGGQGVARGIAAELLPTLSSLAGSFLQSMTEGDKLAKTAAFLGNTMKILYTVAVGVVEVFSTVGKVIGGVMAGVTTVLGGYAGVLTKLVKGDFSGAMDAAKASARDFGTVALAVGADVMSGWKSTAKTITTAWDGSGAAAVEAMGKINKSTVLATDNTKALAKAAKEAEAARLKEQKAIADAAALAIKIQAEYGQRLGQSVAEANREAEANEELVRTFGMSKAAIEAETIARLEDRIERLRGIEMADDEIASIELVIAAKKRSAAAMSSVDTMAANKKATDDMAADYKRMSESLESSLTDALLRGFESGKGFGRNLIDTIKNMFSSLVLRPIISAIVNPVAGALTGAMGLSGTAQAAGGSAASSIGSGISSSLGIGSTLASIGAGAMQTAGAFLTGQIGLGSTLSAGISAIGTGSLSGITAGLSSVVGVLGPIALGIGAAVAIWKKLDTSGTMHAGGAASATSSGVSAVSAGSLNMERIQTNDATQKMVSELASGMVKILDSTAQTFGKAAGYQAATAFADDTSKDGAWGSLVISKMGQSIVNWQDSRGNGKWSQKTFADGKAGQDQYLAALSASVRTALNDIGLPAWAQKMLDGLGGAPSMEEMAKVVEQINLTQRALKSMGEQLQGFASLSDSAVSALIAASGGIEALAGNASAYFDNFYSDAEKSASTVKAIGEVLASVGLSLPATRDEFRKLVESQMAIGESGAPAVAALLKVAGAFAQVNPLMEEMAQAGRSASDVLSERIDLQKQLDQLTLTETQLLAKRRAELDPSNRLLFEQVQALQSARDAQDAAKTSMSGLIDRMKSFGDSARSLRDGLLMGSLSTLTPEQQYAEARRQRDTTLSAAMAGDTSAQGNLSAMQTAFLTISQQVNGGDSRYSSDFAEVLRISDDVAKWSTGQIDTAQASLNVMNDQLAQLVQMNSVMQTIAQAAAPIALVGVPDYSTMGAANTTALVNEVKALRVSNEALTTEVKGLRNDQKQQTGDLIGAAVEISNRESDTVVKGVGAALTRGAGRYDSGVNLE